MIYHVNIYNGISCTRLRNWCTSAHDMFYARSIFASRPYKSKPHQAYSFYIVFGVKLINIKVPSELIHLLVLTINPSKYPAVNSNIVPTHVDGGAA